MLGAKNGWTSKNVTLVEHARHELAHVVGLVRVTRARSSASSGSARSRSSRRSARTADRSHVVRAAGSESSLRTPSRKHSPRRARQEVRHAGRGVVHVAAAELVEGHVLAGHDADHLGAGDEHVAVPVDHEDEVGDGRRVHGAAGARPRDDADLRDHARGARRCAGRCRRSRRARPPLPGCARRPSR